MAFLKARCIAVLSVLLALAVALRAQPAATVEELATALLAAQSEQEGVALMDAHPVLGN